MQQVGSKSEIDFIKSSFTQNKLREVNTADTNQLLGLVLQNASSLTGLKGGVQDAVKDDIKDLIFGKFGNLSLEEVYYAFKLERQLAYPTKTEHYQFFSTEYVAEILTKYTNWKAEKRRIYNIEAPTQQDKQQEMELLYQERERNIQDFIRQFKENLDLWRQSRRLTDLAPILVPTLEWVNIIPIPKDEQEQKRLEQLAIARIHLTPKSRKEHNVFKKALTQKDSGYLKFYINQIRLEELFDRVIANNSDVISATEERLRKKQLK